MHISKSKRFFNEKFSTYCLHIKTKILADFANSIRQYFDSTRIEITRCDKKELQEATHVLLMRDFNDNNSNIYEFYGICRPK